MLAEATTLHPRFRDVAVLQELSDRWAETRRLRIESALAPGLAERLVAEVTARPFKFFERHVNEVRCVLYRQVHLYAEVGEGADDGPIGEARQLFRRDLPALVSAVTGMALRRVDGDALVFDFYTKGSYLDAHTDQGSDRLVAYVVGLTRDTWPAEEGGHLEFLAPDEATVIDRWPPGFGTLDLFAIYPLLRPHRVPVLRQHVSRLSVNGWLTGELKGPLED